jgi:uroporphyrinogen decarboxylase
VRGVNVFFLCPLTPLPPWYNFPNHSIFLVRDGLKNHNIPMTSRELVIKTLNQDPVPRIPRDIWFPAGEESIHPDELAEMNVRYPSDILTPDVAPFHAKRLPGKSGKAGDFTDAWGCVWHASSDDATAELKHSPLAESGKVGSYQPPAGVLDRSRFSKASKVCPTTNRFVLAWSDVRPFDRLRFLRGGDQALVDLARGTKDVKSLLAMLHDLACKELELWAASEVDGVGFRDDWGTDDGLLISAEMWRDLFRPMYRDYCKILHSHDKFVFFHSNGDIADIFGDLVKLDIDAVHSQLRLMNAERLAKKYRGRTTFWGEVDCPNLQNPDAVKKFLETGMAVRRAFDFGHGGVIAQCPWNRGVRLQTIAAFFEQWLVPLPMHESQ